jgi:hypothetical protein
MKKFLVTICVALFFAGMTGCSYDDSDLRNDVDTLKVKVEALKDSVNRINTEIDAIQGLVDALSDNGVITRVDSISTGFKFTLSNGRVIEIKHGATGANAPVIGVREDGGVYYWTSTVDNETTWLLDDQNNKLPVSGVTPVVGIDADGYWTVNGSQITDANGQPVKAKGEGGDSFFRSVTNDETEVTFILADGTEIVIPKAENLAVNVTTETKEYFLYGTTRNYPVTLTGSGSIIITKPDGWKASVTEGILSVTAPHRANEYAEQEGDISVTVIGTNATANKTFAVAAGYNYLIDFEDPRVADYLAGPTPEGDNLYSSYGDDRYYGYDDAGSGLFMMINEESLFYDEPTFSNGGIAISQWNNMTLEGNTNQCSVYYSDITTGKGGYKGSATFAVGYGFDNKGMMWGGMMDTRSSISFQDNTVECVFDHFYVTNNTYAVLSMQNGDDYAKKFSYNDQDWFKLVIEGIDKDGNSTGTVDFYLADFRTPASPGIITTWTKVDLWSLGSVTEIKFDLESSDNDPNGWGMNTPAYFCFDNLAIWK